MHLPRGALSKMRRRENTCAPGPRSEAPFGTGGRAEQEQEEAGVPTRSRPPQSRPPHDAPELCPLSPRKPPAYKTVVDLHDFQSIILWVCGEKQGTRCNKAQPSC